jgi:uncharacterized membrane protein
MQTLIHASLYFAYAALNTLAMAAIKSATQRWSGNAARTAVAIWLLGGALSYAVALVALFVLLRSGEASTVFPIAIGCTVIMTNVVGARAYGERIDGRKLAGTALIVSGITLSYLAGSG